MGYSITKPAWILAGVAALSLTLGGCAAVHTSIAKKDLDVQTKMSDTVFWIRLNPVKSCLYQYSQHLG